jgi:hypothetical protein
MTEEGNALFFAYDTWSWRNIRSAIMKYLERCWENRQVVSDETIFGIFFMGLVGLLLTGCANYYDGQQSDHFDGKRFFNPGKPLDKGLGSFLKWRITAERQEWPEYTELVGYDHPPGIALKISDVHSSCPFTTACFHWLIQVMNNP